MIFWATLAIVNAIWAATGDVDWATCFQVALEVWILVQLHRAETRRRRAHLVWDMAVWAWVPVDDCECRR